MNENRLELLRNMPIFGGLENDVIAALADSATQVAVEKGGFFLHENGASNTVFVLERGRVEILKQWGGRSYRLSHLEAGDSFGEISLLDFGLRSASIRAETDCCALEITSASILNLTRFDPDQFALIYMNMGRELARRLRAADERLFRIRLGQQMTTEYAFRTV